MMCWMWLMMLDVTERCDDVEMLDSLGRGM